MGKTKKKVRETPSDLRIELPTVPNFPYQSRDVTPPVGIVLILATEGGYILGEWDGVYFFDEGHTKIEPIYGTVVSWCILLGDDGRVIYVDGE